MKAEQVRIFIQARGQRGGAYEVARVANHQRAVDAAVRPLLESFDVAYHGVRLPAVLAARAHRGGAVAAGGGR